MSGRRDPLLHQGGDSGSWRPEVTAGWTPQTKRQETKTMPQATPQHHYPKDNDLRPREVAQQLRVLSACTGGPESRLQHPQCSGCTAACHHSSVVGGDGRSLGCAVFQPSWENTSSRFSEPCLKGVHSWWVTEEGTQCPLLVSGYIHRHMQLYTHVHICQTETYSHTHDNK